MEWGGVHPPKTAWWCFCHVNKSRQRECLCKWNTLSLSGSQPNRDEFPWFKRFARFRAHFYPNSWTNRCLFVKRRKQGMPDAETPEITTYEEETANRRKSRANWARLIRKIYEVDPLTCSKCNGVMRILAFIEEEAVIRKILEHLGLWDIPARTPKQGRGPPVIADEEPVFEYADSMVIEYEEAYYVPEYLWNRMKRAAQPGMVCFLKVFQQKIDLFRVIWLIRKKANSYPWGSCYCHRNRESCPERCSC